MLYISSSDLISSFYFSFYNRKFVSICRPVSNSPRTTYRKFLPCVLGFQFFFQIPHINDTTQCVFLLFFAIRFILFSIMISRFIDVLANVRIYFFRLNNIPLCMLCMYICVCVSHIIMYSLCIHHDKQEVSFQVITVNKFSKNIEKYCTSLGLQTLFLFAI